MSKKGCIIVFVVFSAFLFTSFYNHQVFDDESSVSNNTPSKSLNPITNSYIKHIYIIIFRDADFLKYNLPGSGTQFDPYIFENLNISSYESSQAIRVLYSTKHFIIRNCYFAFNKEAIHVENAAIGTVTITNNYFLNNSNYAIEVQSSHNATISYNQGLNNNRGIRTALCDYPNITKNYFESFSPSTDDFGIAVKESSVPFIANNTVRGYHSGISLTYSGYALVINNSCINCTDQGILIHFSGHCQILKNFIANVSFSYGIKILHSLSNDIRYNSITNCSSYGVYIEGTYSRENSIYHNNFFFNNMNGSSQGCDDGPSNSWYNDELEEGNYWSDLNGSVFYNISGLSDSVDLYPLINPLTISISQIVLSPLPADDSYEPNDTFLSAKTLEINSTYELINLDVDYFKLSLTRNTHLEFAVIKKPGNIYLSFELYSEFRARLADGEGSFQNWNLSYDCLYTGDYYLKFDRFEKATIINYTLITTVYENVVDDDHYEENDIFEEAKDLTLPNYTYALTYADPDYFRIALYAGNFLRLSIEFDTNIIDLELYLLPSTYTGDTSEILVSSESSSSIELIEYEAEKDGFFYILVISTDENGIPFIPANYTLTFGITTLSVAIYTIGYVSSFLILIFVAYLTQNLSRNKIRK